MSTDSDAVAALSPALGCGERVSLHAVDDNGGREVIGFVTALDAVRIAVLDRRGTTHTLARTQVAALRRVGVARGRRPEATPRDLLDALADRAGVSGTPWVARISDLLAGQTPPCDVPAWGTWADFDGARFRTEGEWVTGPSTPLPTVLAAAWWGTRMGARSVQLRGDVAPAGFVALS